MKLHGLVSFYDEPVDSIARCLTGLARAGVDHVIALDGAYALYPGGKPASATAQHAAFAIGCRHLGMAHTLHVPNETWAGNEVQKRTALFSLAWSLAEPGDWFLVMDVDQIVTDVPDDLRDQLAATPLDVAETQFVDMVAKRVNRPDWPAEFTVRNLFRAQPIHLETSHLTYVTDDGRYLWGDASKSLEPSLDLTSLVIEHHPDRRPDARQLDKLQYYATRDELGVERGVCEWCDERAATLVPVGWRFNDQLGVPVAGWKEACPEHAKEADAIGRFELEQLGIDPDTVKAENRNGQPPMPALQTARPD